MHTHTRLLDLAGALVVLVAVLGMALPRAVAASLDVPDSSRDAASPSIQSAIVRSSNDHTDKAVPALVRALVGERATAALCVAGAESGWNAHAVNDNPDGSRDRGLFQINSRWHPGVTDAEAFDLVANARYAHALSDGGRDWGAWAVTTRQRCNLP